MSFGIGGSQSSSESTQQTTSASGLGRGATLGKKNKGSVNLGDGSITTVEQGASLTINNPIDNAAAFKVITDTTKAALDAVASAGQSVAQPLGTALQTATTGNANVTDGGAAQASKTVLYLAAIIAAAVALVFYFRK